MHSTMNPPLGNGYDEPARPAWTFQQRTVARAEPTEADEPPDDEPVAIGPAVTPALVRAWRGPFLAARPLGRRPLVAQTG